MGKYDMKPPAPGLYIPTNYAINQQIKEAVVESVLIERQRMQVYYMQRHETFMAQHIKLNDLAMALARVEHAALWATGETLLTALEGQVKLLSGLHGDWLEAVNHLDFVGELKGLPEVNKWVSAHIEGIMRATNKAYDYYDSGELLRQLGSKADAGYNALAFIREEIDRGGAPTKEWRMILADRVETIQAETGVTLRGALAKIEEEIKFMDEPTDEWLYILSEINKPRKTRQAKLNWIKKIMEDHRKQGQVVK